MLNFSIIGGVDVRGRYEPSATNWYVTLIGGHQIDLRQAILPEERPVVINILTLFGGGKVLVAPGTSVELGGFILIGGRSANVAPAAEPPQSRIKVRLFCLAGGLDVRSKAADYD